MRLGGTQPKPRKGSRETKINMNTTASRPEQGRRYKYLLGGACREKEINASLDNHYSIISGLSIGRVNEIQALISYAVLHDPRDDLFYATHYKPV